MSHVLLVDNNSGHLERIADNLQFSGFEVSQAECVVSAFELARVSRPDMILCMEKLPGLDVIDLLELKHCDQELAKVPVVVVGTSSRHKLDCFRKGCDEFIELPVDEPEIIFRICAVLRRVVKSELSGSFGQISLVDVVQMLVAARLDGRLVVEVDGMRGELDFREGQVIAAAIEDREGEDAFLRLLQITRGTGMFGFSVEGVEKLQPNIDKRTDHLLLGLANRIDEQRQ